MKIGLVLFAHGSRVPEANDSVRAVARQAAGSGLFEAVEPAFLELALPDLCGAIGRLAARGVSRVLVVPFFLTLGIHLQRDLPGIVAEAGRIHKDVEIRVSPPLEGHPALTRIVLELAQEALSGWE